MLRKMTLFLFFLSGVIAEESGGKLSPMASFAELLNEQQLSDLRPGRLSAVPQGAPEILEAPRVSPSPRGERVGEWGMGSDRGLLPKASYLHRQFLGSSGREEAHARF